ncbi:MAG: DUF885 family protein, partial [Acidobacteria bacterium]|nr:DUF885 family protein [Acidobacteriota bacterium]
MRHIPLRLAPLTFLLALAIACTPAPPPAEDAAPGTHADLLQLFEEFRVFQEPKIVDGVPDYTAEAMDAQRQGLEDYKSRLAAIDISEWTVSDQIDHHLVRAEMNGLDFHHRVTRPWSRDPAFYLMSQGGAGPAMSGFRSLFRSDPPFDDGELEAYRTTLQGVPKVYEQARTNLTEAVPDLGTIAIWAAPREARIYDEIAEQLAEHHPELIADAEAARDAVLAFGGWVEENKPSWSGAAGIGKENYDWWLRNVHLSPYGWEESRMIVEQEYNRRGTPQPRPAPVRHRRHAPKVRRQPSRGARLRRRVPARRRDHDRAGLGRPDGLQRPRRTAGAAAVRHEHRPQGTRARDPARRDPRVRRPHARRAAARPRRTAHSRRRPPLQHGVDADGGLGRRPRGTHDAGGRARRTAPPRP